MSHEMNDDATAAATGTATGARSPTKMMAQMIENATRAHPPDTVSVKSGVWTAEEHQRYLQAKYANPKASWKEIARLVGTRSARQVILHDQKFRAKMERRQKRTDPPPPPPSVARGNNSVSNTSNNKNQKNHATATATNTTTATTGPQSRGQPASELRYIDSMGVLLLASVASSRLNQPEFKEPYRKG